MLIIRPDQDLTPFQEYYYDRLTERYILDYGNINTGQLPKSVTTCELDRLYGSSPIVLHIVIGYGFEWICDRIGL